MVKDQRNFKTCSPEPIRCFILGKVLMSILVLSDIAFVRSINSTSSLSSSTLGSQKGMAGVNPDLFSPTGRTGFPAEHFFS